MNVPSVIEVIDPHHGGFREEVDTGQISRLTSCCESTVETYFEPLTNAATPICGGCGQEVDDEALAEPAVRGTQTFWEDVQALLTGRCTGSSHCAVEVVHLLDQAYADLHDPERQR